MRLLIDKDNELSGMIVHNKDYKHCTLKLGQYWEAPVNLDRIDLDGSQFDLIGLDRKQLKPGRVYNILLSIVPVKEYCGYSVSRTDNMLRVTGKVDRVCDYFYVPVSFAKRLKDIEDVTTINVSTILKGVYYGK